MEIKHTRIKLPEGVFETNLVFYDISDDQELKDIYKDWRALSTRLQSMHGRGINLPEALSESTFCRAMGTDYGRCISSINGANSSFDVFNLSTHKRIQIKACSVIPDLTSFGPKSVWDEIYFLDFYRKGNWDRTFDIYKIDNDLIYNLKVNVNHTMRDQQMLIRRPRFSIFNEIVLRNSLKPIKTYTI